MLASMNSKPTDVSIVVRCGMMQMLIMFHDLGVTLVRGRRDPERTLVQVEKEELYFVDHPELVELYYDNAWDATALAALAEQFCWEGSKT
jgi:hypothetical protein